MENRAIRSNGRTLVQGDSYKFCVRSAKQYIEKTSTVVDHTKVSLENTYRAITDSELLIKTARVQIDTSKAGWPR